tara:strand:- start:1417 stop:1821 length:405 start_codon:yes stop_codon:yes gene_type:complete
MPYITLEDLTARFSVHEILALADDGTGEIDDAEVARAIEDASGEIDSYVAGGGYTVPLAPVPKIVQSYACDIARYRLYDDAATEQVTKRYDDAIKFLRAVAKGDVKLGIGAPAAPSVGDVQFSSGRRVMPGGGF